jgi:hypothetical protein
MIKANTTAPPTAMPMISGVDRRMLCSTVLKVFGIPLLVLLPLPTAAVFVAINEVVYMVIDPPAVGVAVAVGVAAFPPVAVATPVIAGPPIWLASFASWLLGVSASRGSHIPAEPEMGITPTVPGSQQI